MELFGFKKNDIINTLFIAVLVSIPMPYIVNSVLIIVFVFAFIVFYAKNFVINYNSAVILLLLFFFSLSISVFFIPNNSYYQTGLQKSLPFFIIPLTFLNKKFIQDLKYKKIIKYYSISNVIVALYYITKAIFLFVKTQNRDVFFFQNLVGLDQNAIYISVYASFAMFYFYVQKEKSLFNRTCLMILLFFLFLLSSKTIILIVVLLFIIYYYFFSTASKSVRILTFICSIVFVFFSVYFVPQVNVRVLEEYETAFVDNTINEDYSGINGKTYNVSLNEAWNNKTFKRNQIFPGTAYRVFHIRLFKENMLKNNIWITGYGLNNADYILREQYVKYKIFLSQKYQNFHNQYIQTFAETGIISFILLIAIVMLNLYKSIKNHNFIHIVFSVTMFVLFFTESFLIRQRGIIFFVTLYCLFNTLKVTKKIK